MDNNDAVPILNGDRLLTPEEIAPVLRTTPGAMAVARAKRRTSTPPWIKLGKGKVLYSERAVREWLRSSTINPGESPESR